MKPITTAEIASITGGDIIAGSGDTRVLGISVDSRVVKKKDLFVALPGERTCGHKFVPEALAAGASAALVSQAMEHSCLPEKTIILVPDTGKALLKLGAWYRRQFTVRTVAITGSTGKTTTKDITARVLNCRWPTLKNPGNLNTEIGLPLTLFKLKKQHKIAVLELAMRGLGQIRQLARIAKPEVGVITNVGVAHIELLGSRDNIARAKGELLESLPTHGMAILNGDDPQIRQLSAHSRSPVLYYGLDDSADIFASAIKTSETRTSFTVNGLCGNGRIHLPLIGRFNVYNALTAIAVGYYFGLALDEMAATLEKVESTPMRFNICRRADDALIIDDAYNANPVSVSNALTALADIAQGRRTIAILGDMLELGELAPSAHTEIGELAAKLGLDCLIAAGKWAPFLVEGAVSAGFCPDKVYLCPDTAAAADIAARQVRPKNVVLVKASRGMQFEQIIAMLKQEGCR